MATAELAALAAVAIAFGVANGLNDGGAMLAVGLRLPSMSLPWAIVLMGAVVVAAPLLVGPRVAETFARGLVDFGAGAGRTGLMAAVIACLVVVLALTRLNLPTSLTLALIGGIAGAGSGTGLPVDWVTVGRVLLFAALTPVLAGLFGWLLIRVMTPVRATTGVSSMIRTLHAGGFGLLCLAYGVNDGQKILGVLLVALGAEARGNEVTLPALLAGLLFVLGVPLGLRGIGRMIGEKVVSPRSVGAVTAQVASSTMLLMTGIVGFPVSITQTLAGALVGTTIAESHSRVRWGAAGQLLLAWLLTLPAAFIVGLVLSWLV